MSKTKNELLQLREKMLHNAKINKHGLGWAHWNHCCDLVGRVVEADRQFQFNEKMRELDERLKEEEFESLHDWTYNQINK